MAKAVEKELEEAARAILKELLRKIRELMREQYGLRKVSIRPLGNEASRLSIPCKIVGTKGDDRVPYFAKIMGPSDYVSSLSIQFLKNLYLQMNAKDPIFASPTSAEEMAKYQYDLLRAMHKVRVPSPKPFGYHQIDDTRWLLVVEFIDAKSLSVVKIEEKEMEKAFNYMKILHDNRIFHGDVKPDNIMLGEKMYIVDVGRFRDGVPIKQKKAYDLICLICTFLGQFGPESIVEAARLHNPPRDLKDAAEYIGLVQRRPDFFVTEDVASKLKRLMRK